MAAEQYHPLVEQEMSNILSRRLDRLSTETIPEILQKIAKISWDNPRYSDLEVDGKSYKSAHNLIKDVQKQLGELSCEGNTQIVALFAPKLNEAQEVEGMFVGSFNEAENRLQLLALSNDGQFLYSITYGTKPDRDGESQLNLDITMPHRANSSAFIQESFKGWDPTSGWR